MTGRKDDSGETPRAGVPCEVARKWGDVSNGQSSQVEGIVLGLTTPVASETRYKVKSTEGGRAFKVRDIVYKCYSICER